jgi:hypothetical protein
MTFTRNGRYLVAGSVLVLVAGLGGATYAAAQITGADIKDGTVTTADVHNHTLKFKDLSNAATLRLKGNTGARGPSDAYAVSHTDDVDLTGTFTTVVSLDLPAGLYVASVTGTLFEASASDVAFGDCVLQDGSALGQSAATLPAGGQQYATLAAQVVLNTADASTLDFNCSGTNAGVNTIVLTAVRVGALHES